MQLQPASTKGTKYIEKIKFNRFSHGIISLINPKTREQVIRKKKSSNAKLNLITRRLMHNYIP